MASNDIKSENLFIYGVWLPFDDGTHERFSFFQSCFSLLSADLIENSHKQILIIGDFNADLNRKKRFDLVFNKFICERKLIETNDFFEQNIDYTYNNGNYFAKLDHILSNECAFDKIRDFRIIQSDLFLSDHRAISCEIEQSVASLNESSQPMIRRALHKFPWYNENFRTIYSSILCLNLSSLEITRTNSIDDLNYICEKVRSSMLSAARSAEKDLGRVSSNGVRKTISSVARFIPTMREVIDKIKFIRVELKKSDNELLKNELRFLKRKLRQLQRTHIFERERNDALRLESIKRLDRAAFWKRIATFRRYQSKRATITSEQPLSTDFIRYYSNLFSHNDRPSTPRHHQVEENVSLFYDSIKFFKFECEISEREVNRALNGLKIGKAMGIDQCSNEMFKFGNCDILVLILRCLFNNMVNFGIVPTDFNLSLLKPIPKKGSLSSPADYRPISVSTTLATLFETVLLEKMDVIQEFHRNQFGYKRFTSCKNAHFVVNETLNYYKCGRSNCHVVSLDATKAFDKLWRAGLFYKLINRVKPEFWRILYLYYASSTIIVYVDGIFSERFSTSEGVKQGGILSPFLFNFFIDELLSMCNDSNLGAILGKNTVCAIAYCDDLILLSPITSQMNQLLKMCSDYAEMWKIEFNPRKSVSLSIGKCEKFRLNGTSICEVSGFIYLGLPIGSDKYVEEFFWTKMSKVERAFYSLRGLGCKVSKLNPRFFI